MVYTVAINNNPAISSRLCALCGATRKLEQSHIVPQFVYRWAKNETGVQERQVGLVRPMLCGACEDRFSAFESEFARHVFFPLAANGILAAKYGAWLRKFAASVCWRILEENLAAGHAVCLSGRWAHAVTGCRETWRQYLLGKRPDVAGHHLYWSLWNASAEEPRASMHSITMAVIGLAGAAFVQTKMGPFVLTGVIGDAEAKAWDGTRINAEGKLKVR